MLGAYAIFITDTIGKKEEMYGQLKTKSRGA